VRRPGSLRGRRERESERDQGEKTGHVHGLNLSGPLLLYTGFTQTLRSGVVGPLIVRT